MIDGALIEVDGRPALRFARPLPHSAERVWRAVTEPPFTHVFDPELGPGPQHAAGWDRYLERLEVHLGGDHLTEEDAHKDFDVAHQAYLELFADRGVPVEMLEGQVLRLERRLEHAVARVWRALTDEHDLAEWFPMEGGHEVVESEPQRLLVTTWFGEKLRFELEPDGEGCRLTFTHAFEDPDTSARTAAGWDRCFVRLQALLDGSPLDQREALDQWPTVHERYASAFGADPAIGRAAWVGHAET